MRGAGASLLWCAYSPAPSTVAMRCVGVINKLLKCSNKAFWVWYWHSLHHRAAGFPLGFRNEKPTARW